MQTQPYEQRLKMLVKEGVREALSFELAKIHALFTPNILEKEQKDIEKRYGTPSRKRAKSFPLHV